MSDFFTPPPRQEPPEHEYEQPPWLGPPANELGVPVPLRILLGRTDEVAVALVDVAAFSTGLEFRMEVRLREHDEQSDPFGMHMHHVHRHGGELPDEMLRFGFELADGRRVTNIGSFPGLDADVDDPVLIQRGGGGGGRSWSFGYWLWPLPPAGTLTVVVEWPSQSIELTRVELDAAPLLDAAALSEALWPGAEPSGGGSVTTQIVR
ncbi:MAG TPA: hypothetical protein VIE18_03910 [Gaiellaceae bacterium]